MTRELGLWFFIAVLALAARASNLQTLPLTNAEATDALGVLRLVHGDAATLANPLFSGLQYVLFSVFDANNLLARLPAAWGGVFVCLTPFIIRNPLGRGRALAFAALLALSPVLWLMGRSADGAILAWALTLGAWFCWQRGLSRPALVLAGLVLACGRDAVTPTICIGLAQVVGSRLRDPADPPNAEQQFSPFGVSAIIVLLSFVLGATTLWFNPSGLGSAFNGITDWFAGLTATPDTSLNRLFSGFWLYEIVFVLAALMGMMMAWFERDWRRESAWLMLIIVGVLLCVVNGSRTAASLAPVVIGCAAIAARFIVTLLSQLYIGIRIGQWQTEFTVMGLSAVLLMFAFLSLLQYSNQGQLAWLVSLVVAGLMIVGICLMFSVNGDVLAPVRGLMAAVGLCFAVYTIGNGYQLNFVRADNPGEPYRNSVSSSDLNALVAQIDQLSIRATGDHGVLPIIVDEKAPPSLRWALRDQRYATYGVASAGGSILLTPVGVQPNDQRAYIGDAFTIGVSSNLGNTNCRQIGEKMDCTPLAKWLAFRQITDIKAEQWTLWLGQDVAALASGVR